LKNSVELYNLGTWAQPDSQLGLEQAIQKAIDKPATPDWDLYIKENSWKRNAKIVISQIFPVASR
jgi:hypothetical protein